MTEVYLALGSNVGDSRANLATAIELLDAELNDIKEAPIYRTKAVGYTDQPDFLNTAILAETDLPPLELLHFIKQVETEVGRVARFRWGPREIDIDIIFYGRQIIMSAELTIPHPRFAERDFVLRPLVDLNPSLIDPLSKVPVITYLTDLTDKSILN